MAAPCEDDDVVDNNIIDYFNREFGDDLKSLRKVEEIYNELSALKDDLEQKVIFFIILIALISFYLN